MKNKNDKILIITFFFILFAFFVVIAVSDGGNRSERENRYLERRPSVSVETLLDGSYFRSLSAFCADNVPLRGTLVNIKALCEYGTMKLENNKIIIGRSRTLIERAELDLERLAEARGNVESLKHYLNTRGITLYSFVLPLSEDGKSDMQPIPYGRRDYSIISEYLIETDADMYYKSDHHLNYSGSLYVYREIAIALGIPIREFPSTVLSESFLGRSYYSSGLPAFSSEMIVSRENDFRVTTQADGNSSFCGFIDYSKLESTDKYSAFFGGNHAQCYAYSDPEKETVIVIKDSYALSVLTFLLDDYNILMLDPRYAKRELPYYLDSFNVKKVIILCSADTFSSNQLRRYITPKIIS